MPFALSKNMRELVGRYHALGQRLLSIRTRLGVSEVDARSVAISNCYLVNVFAEMILNVLRHMEEVGMYQREFENLFGGISGSYQAALDNFSKMARLGFIVVFQFQIENMMKNILNALGRPVRPTEGFYNVASKLLEAIGVEGRESKLDLLYLPALIRNSLHANGIHRLPTKRIEFDGVVFEFIQDRAVNCATWDHKCLALNASLNVIEEILDASPVRSLPMIAEAFVAERAASGTL